MMNLTVDEWTTLATRHGNSYEAAQLRNRLIAAGFHFCSSCKAIKPSERFPVCARLRGGRATRCHECSRTQRKGDIQPHGLRWAENSARHRAANLAERRADQLRWWHENKDHINPNRRRT